MGIVAYYNIEYNIWFHCQFVVDLIVEFGFTEDVEFLQNVHHLAFVCKVNGFHYLFNWAYGMPIIQLVLVETGLAISVFEISEMPLETGSKRSISLFYEFFIACGAG